MTFSFSRWQAEARRICGYEGVPLSPSPFALSQIITETDEARTHATFSLLTALVIQRFDKPSGIEVMLFSERIFKMLTNVYNWKVKKPWQKKTKSLLSTPTVTTLRGRPPRTLVSSLVSKFPVSSTRLPRPPRHRLRIADKCDEAIMWLDANQLAEVEELTDKQKEVEGICNLMIR